MNAQSNPFQKRFLILAGFATGALIALSLAPAAVAQPAGNEMCGDGTTFTVQLPGTSLGIDNSDGFFRNVIVPDPGPADSITLPKGCRLYVLLVSGYRQNVSFNQIIFYKVAEFAAKNNGYVHVAWWNNLLKEYMGGPLHPATVTIERLFLHDIVIDSNPGDFSLPGLVDVALIVQAQWAPDVHFFLAKANPASDQQFVSDALRMIHAIKVNNPDALIVVAGHSMGGDSVARLGRSGVPIDLLAAIDPANNQDLPRGIIGQYYFNWTRWRATNFFQGFKQWDCVRNSVGLCRDFDSRIFHVQYQCRLEGNFLSKPPVFSTRAPIACPAALPYADPGTQHRFGSNIKHLYHRWQTESLPPFDFNRNERFNFPAPLSSSILGPNYQQPFLQNDNSGDKDRKDPDKTCSNITHFDPRRQGETTSQGLPFLCSPIDGHGEIVGYRFSPDASQSGFLELPGLEMRNWPFIAAERRTRMLQLPTADASWPHRPTNPDTCMVCDDIIDIVKHLMAQQAPPAPTDTTAPVSLASAAPGPNPNGWNAEDVVITLSAVDEAGGSGVKEIERSITGAQASGTVITPGNTAQETITAEGTTTLAFFARDNAANVEATKSLDVKLDKTPPEIAAVTDVQHNAGGWIRMDVLVSFPASDALSGLASSSPQVQVSTEGANQDITGTAEDNAGNQATAIVTLNIDKTAPGIALASRTPAANAAGWNNTDVHFNWDCTDALSGPASSSVTQSLTNEGAAQMIIGICTDLADNTASDTQSGINIDKTSPAINITTPPNSATYLLNAAVNSDYNCTDNLSGVESCNGPVASGAAVNTATVGNKQFTVNSSDVAGNSTSARHNYAVHYAFSGFANPIGPMPIVNVVKAGRTVPIKYALQDANSAFIPDLASFVTLMSAPVDCDSNAPGVLAEETDASGSTAIRYDATANQFIYNWKTDASWAGTCRALQLTLNDGTQHLAIFRFQ